MKVSVVTPMIGEPVQLNNINSFISKNWWEEF
jgi:hypothetical protein